MSFKNIKECLKNEYLFCLTGIILALLFYIYSRKYYEKTLILDGSNEKIVLLKLMLEMTIVLVVIVVLVCCKYDQWIAMTVMLIGIMFVYFQFCPNGMAPDERNHFLRAFEISRGSLISEHVDESGTGGNNLPQHLCEYGDKNVQIDPEVLEIYEFSNTSLYAPINYFPQALGIKITSVFTNKPALLFYGGRIANAIVNLLLCIGAFYFIPFGKKIIFTIIMFPMTLQEMVSMSSDGLTITISVFFLAYVLYLSYGSDEISKNELSVLWLLGFILSLCKIVYIVELGLIILIPNSKFKTNGNIFKIIYLFVGIIVNTIWLSISSGYLIEYNKGVNAKEQLKFIISHIYEYFIICVDTVFEKIMFWIQSMIGSSLGALNIPTWPGIWLIIAMLLVYEVSNSDIVKVRRKWDPFVLIGVFMLGMSLILTSLYVQWTPLKEPIVDGVQGRYFIPIIATFIFSMLMLKGDIEEKTKKGLSIKIESIREVKYWYIILWFCNSIVVLDVFGHYLER